jgi:hypothetical protein
MGVLQDYKNDFILMIESGFIAVNQSDEDAALKLFNTAALLDPTNSLAKLGVGYIHLCRLELPQATDVFAEIVKKEPTNDMAKTLLGLSQSLNPKEVAKGEKTLEESARNARDPFVKNAAVTALDFVDRFIKTVPPPIQGNTPKRKA